MNPYIPAVPGQYANGNPVYNNQGNLRRPYAGGAAPDLGDASFANGNPYMNKNGKLRRPHQGLAQNYGAPAPAPAPVPAPAPAPMELQGGGIPEHTEVPSPWMPSWARSPGVGIPEHSDRYLMGRRHARFSGPMPMPVMSEQNGYWYQPPMPQAPPGMFVPQVMPDPVFIPGPMPMPGMNEVMPDYTNGFGGMDNAMLWRARQNRLLQMLAQGFNGNPANAMGNVMGQMAMTPALTRAQGQNNGWW